MYGVIITAIICITILILMGIFYGFKNTFVDEIAEKTNITDPDDDIVIGRTIIYKRTYKNGKIKYIRKVYYNKW